VQVREDNFKCPCKKFSACEAETSGPRRDMKSDFNVGFLGIIGRQEEFLTPTIAGVLLCVPELGRSSGLLL
jgi:hypothetical protein